MKLLKYLSTAFTAVMAAISTPVIQAQDTADYSLQVQNFVDLTVVDGVNVEYKALPDSAGWAVFTCPPEIASQIMFNNNRDHLTIQTAAWEHPVEGMPRVRVYSMTLRSATNSGDSTLVLSVTEPVQTLKIKQVGNGAIEADSVEAENLEASIATGSGTIRVHGKARKAKLHNVGTGKLDASRLEVDEAGVFIFGSGPVDCFVGSKMTVYGVGSGRVRLHTQPNKIVNRSIGVKVEDAEMVENAE